MSEKTPQTTGPPDLARRNVLVEQLLPIIPAVYGRLRKAGRLRHVDADEALSYGAEGLIQAVESWRPELGARLESWAGTKVLSRLLDADRKLRPTEICFSDLEHAGKGLEELGAARCRESSPGVDLCDLLRMLPGPERAAVQRVILDGLTQREAAAEARVTHERIRQRLRCGLDRLRSHLQGQGASGRMRNAG